MGLVALTTDDLNLVEEFRKSVAQVELDGRSFITLPKQMLLTKYALTVYFGRIFQRFDTRKLMYWLGTLNKLEGKFEILETRYFSKTHDNPRRRGARIVAFEGNQKFLDSLHKFPKDYPFSIRFGGNLYIRGGDRYAILYISISSSIYLTQTQRSLVKQPKYLTRKINLVINTTYLKPNSPNTCKLSNNIYDTYTYPRYLPSYLHNFTSLTIPDATPMTPMRLKAIDPVSIGPRSRKCLEVFVREYWTAPTGRKTSWPRDWLKPTSTTTTTTTRQVHPMHEKQEEEEEEEDREEGEAEDGIRDHA